MTSVRELFRDYHGGLAVMAALAGCAAATGVGALNRRNATRRAAPTRAVAAFGGVTMAAGAAVVGTASNVWSYVGAAAAFGFVVWGIARSTNDEFEGCGADVAALSALVCVVAWWAGQPDNELFVGLGMGALGGALSTVDRGSLGRSSSEIRDNGSRTFALAVLATSPALVVASSGYQMSALLAGLGSLGALPISVWWRRRIDDRLSVVILVLHGVVALLAARWVRFQNPGPALVVGVVGVLIALNALAAALCFFPARRRNGSPQEHP